MGAPSIPPPRLQQVRNRTPFPHFQFDKMGKGQRFHDVVIACGSFVLAQGMLRPAAAHRGPVFADAPWMPDRAVLSSLREATDVVLAKPGADVYVTGAARAIDWAPRPAWEAKLRVERDGAPLVDKALRLTGPRHWLWHDDPAERRLSDPEPAAEVALRYELAYGGWWFDQGDAPDGAPRVHASNPSGTGRFGSACRDAHPQARYHRGQRVPGPQIEYVAAPVLHGNQDVEAAGFGPIARHWQPRAALAGTYDEAWRRRFAGAPFMDYAEDFDERFFQYAPTDQVAAQGLAGDEQLSMAGFFASAPAIDMQLPGVRIDAICRTAGGSETTEPMRLDTVHLDLDQMLVHLTWRLTLDQSRDITGVDLFAQGALS
jgi:hypothetical protein